MTIRQENCFTIRSMHGMSERMEHGTQTQTIYTQPGAREKTQKKRKCVENNHHKQLRRVNCFASAFLSSPVRSSWRPCENVLLARSEYATFVVHGSGRASISQKTRVIRSPHLPNARTHYRATQLIFRMRRIGKHWPAIGRIASCQEESVRAVHS